MQAVIGVVVGGLSWYYCSNSCEQRRIDDLSLEMEELIRDCSGCTENNEELLGVLAGGEPPVDENSVTCPHLTFTVPETQPAAESHLTQQDTRCPLRKCRPGKIANNSFFNFVRERRRDNCGQQQTELVRAAAADWNILTEEQKSCYQKKNVFKNNRNRQ